MRCRRFVEWLKSQGCEVERRAGPSETAGGIVVRRGPLRSELPDVAPDARIDSALVQKTLIDLGLDLASLPDLDGTND